MPRLGDLLRPKALSFILAWENGTIDKAFAAEMAMMKAKDLDRLVEWEEIDHESKESIYSLKDFVLYNEMLHALRSKEPARCEAIRNEIRAKGADAEIDIGYLERKFPLMKPLNEMFRIYGAQTQSHDGQAPIL